MSTDPRPATRAPPSPARSSRSPRSGDLDAGLGAILAAAAAALRRADGRGVRPGSRSAGASAGRPRTGSTPAPAPAWRRRSLDPAHPFATAATSRIATFDREATGPDGTTFVGAYLPLIVSSGGVDVSLGSIGLAGPAPHALDAAERETLQALASLAAIAIDRSRLGSTAAERSEWFERMAHTDPLTGHRQRADGRPGPRARDRPGRPAGRRGLVRHVRRRRLPGDEPRRRQRGRRRRAAPGRGGAGRIGPAGRHRRADRWRRVRRSWRPARPDRSSRTGSCDGIAALPAVGGRVVSVSAGVAHFPADGDDAQRSSRRRPRRSPRRGATVGAWSGRGSTASAGRDRRAPRPEVAGLGRGALRDDRASAPWRPARVRGSAR